MRRSKGKQFRRKVTFFGCVEEDDNADSSAYNNYVELRLVGSAVCRKVFCSYIRSVASNHIVARERNYLLGNRDIVIGASEIWGNFPFSFILTIDRKR